MIELLSEPVAEHAHVLACTDPSALDEAGLVRLIEAADRLRSRVQALQDAALVAWDRLMMPAVGDSDAARLNHRWASDELGLVLGVSPGSASARVTRAVTLATRLPAVAADLRSGVLGVTHAERLAAVARNVPVAVARDAAEITLADRGWRTPLQVERVFTAAVLRLDPDGAAQRARVARRSREVRQRPEADGMATLTAFLPAADCAAVFGAVDARARSSQAGNVPGDHRTLAERRADALVELVTGTGETDGVGDNGTDSTGDAGPKRQRGPAGRRPRVHGRRIDVQVTVAWSTLIGLDDLPADLTGYGPIDATTARRLAADPNSVWRRLLVDPTSGRLLDRGSRTYRPPQDLADHVIARDATCRFPGCEKPATVCDLDHRTPYGTPGGLTTPANLDPLCEHHHRLKHEGGWTHHRDPDTGDSLWTSPRGTTYGRPAHTLPHGPPAEKPSVAPNESEPPPPF